MAKADKVMEGFSYHSKIYFEGENKPNELFVSQDQVYSVLVERDKQIDELERQLAEKIKWSDGICDYCYPDECSHGPRRRPE